MRLLIDECIDQRLRVLFPDHDCQTAGFEVLITVEQNIPDQQDLARRTISILILCAPTNRLRDLEPLVIQATSAPASIQPGQVLRIKQA
jgi:hypothetical protein